jgi:hypothetical protein
VSPTYAFEARFARDLGRLTRQQRAAVDAARAQFVEALRQRPPSFPPKLRVKRVQGHPGIWELTWAHDGRATFAYGGEVLAGEAHVIWRRIGDHSILADP